MLIPSIGVISQQVRTKNLKRGERNPTTFITSIQYLKVDIRTNKPLNVEFRYASHVASRYKTDHRLVLMQRSYLSNLDMIR